MSRHPRRVHLRSGNRVELSDSHSIELDDPDLQDIDALAPAALLIWQRSVGLLVRDSSALGLGPVSSLFSSASLVGLLFTGSFAGGENHIYCLTSVFSRMAVQWQSCSRSLLGDRGRAPVDVTSVVRADQSSHVTAPWCGVCIVH